jgi:hypothetical protein
MKKPTITTIALLSLLATAHALDAPQMKEGLWKIHTVNSSPGSAPTEFHYSLCHDHAYDKRVEDMMKNMKSCVISQETVGGNKRSYTSTCKVAGITITGKATVTWTSDTAARSETHTTYNPAYYGKTSDTTVMEQTWTGPCPAGMNPGDRILASGKIDHHH